MLKNLLCFSLTVMLLFGCNNNDDTKETKTLDFGHFTINVPKAWEQVESGGVDSYVGGIKIDTDKVVNFDLGWYSNALNEDDNTRAYMIADGNIYIRDKPKVFEGKEINNYKYFDVVTEANLQKVRQNIVRWINIDGYKAKLVLSKQTSNGITGVYIDSLWNAGDSRDKFMMCAYMLNEAQRFALIKAFKSLKFNKDAGKK